MAISEVRIVFEHDGQNDARAIAESLNNVIRTPNGGIATIDILGASVKRITPFRDLPIDPDADDAEMDSPPPDKTRSIPEFEISLAAAIKGVLEVAQICDIAHPAMIRTLRNETNLKCEALWAVCAESQDKPDKIVFGTNAEREAWIDGFAYAEGWCYPCWFDSEDEAIEYLNDARDDDEDDSD